MTERNKYRLAPEARRLLAGFSLLRLSTARPGWLSGLEVFMGTHQVSLPPWSRRAPEASLLVVATTDFLLGSDTGLLALFSVGPALTASGTLVRRSVRIGACAMTLCVLCSLYDNLLGTLRSHVALAVIALATAAAALSSQARARLQQQLRSTTSVAEAAQQAILRPIPDRCGPLSLAAAYTSAARTAQIGGDLHEVLGVRGGVRIIVGDVQGKGLDAVQTASVVLGAFRESAPFALTLDTVADRIECSLARHTGGEKFVTAVLAEIADDGTTVMVNFGHPAPVILRPDRPPEPASPARPGLPLGLRALADPEPGRYHTVLAPGQRILFHTDGLTEARGPDGTFYPLAERAALLTSSSLGQYLSELRADVTRYTHDKLDDDSALLLVRFSPPPGHAPPAAPPPGTTEQTLRSAGPESAQEDAARHPDFCTICSHDSCSLRTGPFVPGMPRT